MGKCVELLDIKLGDFPPRLGGVRGQHVLHAQAKPPAFVLGEVTVKDEDEAARKAIGDKGGKYIGGKTRTKLPITDAAILHGEFTRQELQPLAKVNVDSARHGFVHPVHEGLGFHCFFLPQLRARTPGPTRRGRTLFVRELLLT
jgi:hypothetical protein